jgi:WD40 repeat protein
MLIGALVIWACAGPQTPTPAPSTGWAQQKPFRATPKLETGSHIAPVRALSTDAAGRILATISPDKTVRLWDAATLKLLRVIRPVSGSGVIGFPIHVRVSPDGQRVAVGMWMGRAGNSVTFATHIFDTATGSLQARIPQAAGSLRFSPDSSLLAIGGRGGISLYRTNSGVGVDVIDCPSMEYDFVDNKHIVALCPGYLLRLYERYETPQPTPDSKGCAKEDQNERPLSPNTLWCKDPSDSPECLEAWKRRLPKVDVPGLCKRVLNGVVTQVRVQAGDGHGEIQLSPDRQQVAVVLNDDQELKIFSVTAQTLKLSKRMALGFQFINSIYSDVSWALSGSTVFAKHSTIPATLVKVDLASGQPTAMPTPVMDLITSLLGLADDRVALIHNATPDIVLWTEDKPVVQSSLGTLPLYKYRLLPQQGALVLINEERCDASLKVPDMSAASVSVMPLSTNDPARPHCTSPHPRMKRVQLPETAFPVDFSKRAEVEEYLSHFAIDISRDHTRGVIATQEGLASFQGGSKSWVTEDGIGAFDVAYTQDERQTISLHYDGTIRWYKSADGTLLATLFIHPDLKKWVLFSPSGYYIATEEGESLLGWEVARDSRESDFFPAAQFRDQYFRPDVIRAIFERGDEGEAVAKAALNSPRTLDQSSLKRYLPPIVRILDEPGSIQIKDSKATFRVSIRSPSGLRVTQVHVIVNGAVMPPSDVVLDWKNSADPSEEREGQITVKAPIHDSVIVVTAETRHGISTPVELRAQGQALPTQLPVSKTKPRLLVLSIGVSKYGAGLGSLRYAGKDAQDFANLFKAQEGRIYGAVKARLLVDDGPEVSGGSLPSQAKIREALGALEKEAQPDDVIFLFLAGHGVSDKGAYYFLPTGTSRENLQASAISAAEFQRALRVLTFERRARTFVFLDTYRTSDDATFAEWLSREVPAAIIFSASSPGQMALEGERWNNGAFTCALVDAFSIQGKATELETGVVTISRLYSYLREAVPQMTDNRQVPALYPPVETFKGTQDLPLARLNSGAE